MANSKISELPPAGPLQDTDLVPVVQSSGNEHVTARTTIGALSSAAGGGGWSPSEKYEFGSTWFRIRNMQDNGWTQVFADENPNFPAINLFAKSSEPNRHTNTPWLKLHHNEPYVSLGINGSDVFAAFSNITTLKFNNNNVFTANDSITQIRYGQGNLFSAEADGVQIQRNRQPVFGAYDSKTDLNFRGNTVFSAGEEYVGVYMRSNSPILEAGYSRSGKFGDTFNHYTELHRYNNDSNRTERLLHADRYVLNLFHKNRPVLDFGTEHFGTVNQSPFSSFLFVDDRGERNFEKKIIEASPFYTTLYFDNRAMLDFKRNSFVLNGIIDHSNRPLPLIVKYSGDTFVSFHDLSSNNANSSVFMQASAAGLRMFRDIDLVNNNRDIRIATGRWSQQSLRTILDNIEARITTLESR